ncbi:plasmid stabilization protein [Inquilinus sp. NPDC058860]|uniref:FitA-like ribbon-helix-helix domain-containing protein n=1 Tax=Inquilinus sp. NPDC058860 TaxID=3346652 RepID=UPI003674129B
MHQLDAQLMACLRQRAACNGHTIEDEALQILRSALSRDRDDTANLADAIRQRFEWLGGIDLPEMPREAIPKPLRLDE